MLTILKIELVVRVTNGQLLVIKRGDIVPDGGYVMQRLTVGLDAIVERKTRNEWISAHCVVIHPDRKVIIGRILRILEPPIVHEFWSGVRNGRADCEEYTTITNDHANLIATKSSQAGGTLDLSTFKGIEGLSDPVEDACSSPAGYSLATTDDLRCMVGASRLGTRRKKEVRDCLARRGLIAFYDSQAPLAILARVGSPAAGWLEAHFFGEVAGAMNALARLPL